MVVLMKSFLTDLDLIKTYSIDSTTAADGGNIFMGKIITKPEIKHDISLLIQE